MRVVITQPIHASQVDRLRAAGHEVSELASPCGVPSSALTPLCQGADALICQLTDRIDACVLNVPGLRVVANVAAGYDNIDVQATSLREVHVTNTPGVLTEASADLALALILSVARHIPTADATVRSGAMGPWRLLHDPMGLDLHGATLGVVGIGRIGKATARRAHFGFGMKIAYHSRDRDKVAEEELRAEWMPLRSLLQHADVISLHAPLTPQTRHLINAETLNLMKPNAILVNTARGELVREPDLAHALAQGRLGGAGLDVFENEPHVHPDLLACGGNVVLTPHIGSATAKTRQAMTSMAVDNVLAVLSGGRPLNPVA
ncbi:2-hydroxyacid dehydrogenase [Streptomyces sp. NPDC059272]|uniref:2-hydroxyacid dehydrogenase n=1 Tax=Streptomyces sp. NPDC059272 TaxID=3346800 RepID=UPI00368A89C4